ncbi:MAG: hypothetical protein MMC33_010188 [Icmadophila ericetorum]|nr:hypothetical protein [Icmadophila ericetorum]
MAAEPPSPATHYAVLIGVCFTPLGRRKEWQPLKGCVRDVQSMRKQLMKSFPRCDTRVLTATCQHPDDAHPSEDQAALPTYRNILSSLERISSEAAAGSYVYIHFTGHGTTVDSSSPFARNGIEELALVVLAADGSEIQYLRSTELAYQLHNMVEKGLKVTVVLDCCASGGVVRKGLHPLVKCLPYDLAVDMAHPPGPERDPSLNKDNEEDTRPVHRAASSRRNWLIDPDGYVVITACGPTEKALELKFDEGQFHGALSYFLTRAFIRRGGVGGKHQHIYSYLVSRFRERCPSQRPMIYGNKTLSFFTDSTFSWHAAPIPVIQTATGLQLEAGLAHGVCSGDLFAIDQDDPTSDHAMTSTSNPVTFRATEICGLTSTLELVDTNAEPFAAASGLTAIAMTRLSLRRHSVGIDLRIPRSEAWTRAVNNRASLHIVYLDRTEDTTTLTFIVTVLSSEHYQIFYRGILYPGEALPKSMYPLEENAEFVLDVLEKLAIYYDTVNSCEPNHSTNQLRKQFGASLVANDDRNYPSLGRDAPKADVKEGDSLELVVLNFGTSALYVHVFVVGASMSIEDLLYASYEVIPQRFSDNPLDFYETSRNSGEWRLKVRMSLPKEMPDNTDWVEDYIKVCITTKPTSFSSLEQPELGEFLRLRRTNRHRRGGQDTSASPEDWAMLTFCVRTWKTEVWEEIMTEKPRNLDFSIEDLELLAEDLD